MREGEMWRHMRKQFGEMADTVDAALRRVPGIGALAREMYPPVNVYENPEEIIVRADLPGVAKPDLDIELLDRTLSIRGNRPPDAYEDYRCRAAEIPSGEFSREVRLPAAVDQEAEANATLHDGVLTVRLKKQQPERGRTIPVEEA